MMLQSLAAPLILWRWILLHFGANSLFVLVAAWVCPRRAAFSQLNSCGHKHSLVGFLHALFSSVRLTRFHPDLSWFKLLALSTFWHMYNL